ncbi:unnamed protein product [Nippostrongylus brasiliensis]|uniref:Protein kinase domain-containing protein n=1 Tax=Nippostrongylus brasiliensis TaxID=27835 RepID=A0A0N4YRP6_NIPBR|nr:unnamed protein product [Nippostrongylus brasiliensis]
MRPKLFNRKTFDKDIRRLTSLEEKSKANASAPQSGCCQNGYNFLSHIVAFGHHDEVKYSNWIAYEFITGSPLDRCLQRLKYLNNFMSTRQKSEILYQDMFLHNYNTYNGTSLSETVLVFIDDGSQSTEADIVYSDIALIQYRVMDMGIVTIPK